MGIGARAGTKAVAWRTVGPWGAGPGCLPNLTCASSSVMDNLEGLAKGAHEEEGGGVLSTLNIGGFHPPKTLHMWAWYPPSHVDNPTVSTYKALFGALFGYWTAQLDPRGARAFRAKNPPPHSLQVVFGQK